MAYYVMTSPKRGSYEALDITKSPIFMKESKFNIPGACELKEIDDLTMQFNDEEELKQYLFDSGLLSQELYDKPLSIRRKEKDQYIKLIYGFLYQDSIEYMNNPKSLIKYIQRKSYHDYLFLQKFASFFSDTHDCKSTCPELLSAANNTLNTQCRSRHLDELDQNNDDLITRVVKLIIYEYKQLPNGKVNYFDKIKYTNLHKMVAFIQNYNYKQEAEKKITEPKKRIIEKPKKGQIKGQYTLFD